MIHPHSERTLDQVRRCHQGWSSRAAQAPFWAGGALLGLGHPLFRALLEYSCLENPRDGGPWWAAVHGVAKSRAQLSDFTFTFHFHALEKEMATHSSVLAWRIPGTGEPGGLPSMGSHRVRHDLNDLAAAAAEEPGQPCETVRGEAVRSSWEGLGFQPLHIFSGGTRSLETDPSLGAHPRKAALGGLA